MKLLTQLSSKDKETLREWCRKQPLKEETKSSYVKGRKEAWYFLGSNLQSVKMGRGKIFEAPIPKGPGIPALIDLGDKFLRGWNSLLVCGGPTTITWHRDHAHFFGPAVMVNLGEADYSEADRNAVIDGTQAIKFQTYRLNDGDVVWIDTKLPHCSTQIAKERFNLTFRTIKPEYL